MKNNKVTFDYTGITEEAVGAENGIRQSELDDLAGRAKDINRWMLGLKNSGEIGFFTLPEIDTQPIKKFASRVREKYDNMVVLGIGGSALGTSAIYGALKNSYSHLLTKRKRNGYPKLFIADNIDPDSFDDLLQIADPKKTLFNVISKSGTTAETISQFMIVFDRLKQKLKGKWKKKIVITTDAKKGFLRDIVRENNLTSFEVPDNVGGRFSVFSAVGLVPLACAGIDIDELLTGAAEMANRCDTDNLYENPAYMLGATLYLADTKKKKPMVVMMPYSSRLYGVADWFRQLWAESLGKRLDSNNKEVHTGQTPIKALGATDQHSQVQLYVEGPNDKVVVFLEVDNFAKKVEIPNVFTDREQLSYLAGSSLNDLIKVEKEGTQYALTKHNRPNMTIIFPELSAHTLGQFIQMLETATVFAGGLYGINPFDQPGVEFGKNYAYAMMGRKGYEKLKADIDKEGKDIKRKLV